MSDDVRRRHATTLPDDYPLPAEALRLIARAEAAERHGHRVAAREQFNAALGYLDRVSHAAASAAIMRRIGCLHLDDGNPDAALDAFASAIAMAGAGADRSGVATAYALMAGVYQLRGEVEHSEVLSRHACEAADRHGTRLGRWVA